MKHNEKAEIILKELAERIQINNEIKEAITRGLVKIEAKEQSQDLYNHNRKGFDVI